MLCFAAGVSTAGGQFATGTPFKGTLNSKNQMTVAVEGSKCELTYALKPVGKPVPVDAKDAAAAKEPAADSKGAAAGAAAAPAESPAPAPKKSAAAATSSASALVAVLCAVLAFVL